ncbi:MAG: DUF885 domain-containing protein [Candidatus Dormiibacterota bacterium]
MAEPGMAGRPGGAAPESKLADTFWRAWLALDPLRAGEMGFHDQDAEMPAVSEEARAAQRRELRSVGGALETGSTAPAAGRATAAALAGAIDVAIAGIDVGLEEFTLATNEISPQAKVLQQIPRVTIPDAEAAERFLGRLARIDRYVTEAADRLLSGTAAGRPPTRRGVAGALAQLDAYLARGTDDPLRVPCPPPKILRGWPSWEGQRNRLLQTAVVPALRRFRNVIEARLLPVARDDEHGGLCWVSGGEERYAASILEHTSLPGSPRAIHELGLAQVEALALEYRDLGQAVFGISDPALLFGRLREDPALRFSTEADVVAVAEQTLARARSHHRQLVGHPPQADCVVRPKPPLANSDSTIGYQPPDERSARPGTYWLTTTPVHTRLRFEAEALAFHEGIPGHHTQIALSHELAQLHHFQRYGHVSAFAEGWALYAERLADEVGLYDDDLARLGVLSLASRRACRLVADTGLHALGWSRAQAIDYLRRHSPQDLQNIEIEVDRYLTWPGQGLSYGVGADHFRSLRRRAEATLGSGFDLGTFHDVVLGHGTISLGALSLVVDDYLALAQGTGGRQ